MPIVGFNFDKSLVEKSNKITGPVQVKNDMQIVCVNKEKVELNKRSDETLRVDFAFTSKYEPNLGKMLFNGHILYIDEPNELKKLFDSWAKEKKIPPQLMTQIINTILVRCTIKALAYSQDVNLPPHIRLPTIMPKVKVSDYIR